MEPGALLASGGLLVDTSAELGAPLPGPAAPASRPPHVRPARPEDLAALLEIAAGFTANRFHRDPRLPRERAAAVHARWITAASRGEHGRALVAVDEGQVAGFATLSPPDDALGVAVTGLVAVHPAHRGRRLLERLVAACAAESPAAEPWRALYTSTQVSNVAALRAFTGPGRGCSRHPS